MNIFEKKSAADRCQCQSDLQAHSFIFVEHHRISTGDLLTIDWLARENLLLSVRQRWNGRRVWRHVLLGRCCASRAFHSHFRISFRKRVKLFLQLFLNSCQKEFMHPSKIDFFSVLSGSATKKRRLENKIVSNLSSRS